MRTVIWFFYFWLCQLALWPVLKQVQRLERQGEEARRRALVNRCVAAWASSLLRLAGVKVQVTGRENIPAGEAVVFAGNHQGNFDVPLALTCLDAPHSIMAKAQLSRLPFIRAWMEQLRCVFLEREDPRKAAAALGEAVRLVTGGESMVIFPEGTRSKGPQMGEFKGGAFRVALKTGAPIVPMAIDGSYRIMEAHGVWIHPARVQVSILPPLSTAGMSREEAKALPEKVKGLIQQELDRLRSAR